MAVTIREATKEDINAVFELIKGLAVFEKSLEKLHNSPEQMARDWELFHALVAEDNKKIIGMTVFNYSYHTWSGKSLYLDDLYVLEEYRGQGVGTSLLKKIIFDCKRGKM